MDKRKENWSVKNLDKYITIFIILALSISLISTNNVSAEENQTIEIEVKYTNGDIVDFNSMKVVVYQDFEKEPFLENKLSSNPDFILVPENHRYKIEVYVDGMYADVGYVKLETKPVKEEITIPLSGGLQFSVFYENGETPIKGATVILKTHDNSELRRGITNDEGNTVRYWIQSTTKQQDHYVADVYLEDLFLTSYFPIKIVQGTFVDQKIITKIPEIVEDLVTINLFSGTDRITSKDGNYKVNLLDLYGNKIITSDVNFRGDAQFSNLRSGTYVVKINSDSNFENLLWPQTAIHVTGDVNEFKIFKNKNNFNLKENPLLSCNCVSFRLDDVQDHWLSDTQIEIMNLFAEKNIPLTIGVVGKLIGTDDKLISSIKKNLEEESIEIANHSWDNESLINLDENAQSEKILNSNQKITDIFGVTPKIFVPPQNLYDSTTIDVLKKNNFSYLISHITDNEAIFIDEDSFYNIPATTETGILLDASQWELRDNEYVQNKIIENLNTQGYSIIMIHPQEFSLNNDGEYGIPNQESISKLRTLLDEVSKLDSNIVRISEITPTEEVIVEKPLNGDSIETCDCVAFRLDGVQDYWLNEVQISIMKTFAKNDTPLTIGIIANAFGNDPKITEFVNNNLAENPTNLEIATKGIGLTPFTNYDKEKQNKNLKESIQMIELNTNVKPRVFIPPDNKFNSETLDILEENNITHISASLVNGDSPPFEFTGEQIYRFPQTSATGKFLPSKNIFQGVKNEQIIFESIQSIQNYGFSVISIQPQEFSNVNNSTHVNSANAKQIENLEKLIDEFDNLGYKIVSIGEINSNVIITVPKWIKNNAGWWADGQIDDRTFVQGIEYLVKEKLITVSEESKSTTTEQNIPKWIKNNAGGWADGQIDDRTFVQGIEYLVKTGIIMY
ncbi:MAG: polysaccharide deacetylase family protein [Nitrosopumilus sp.]|nr:polysaccharide deacetylase family protein [Nitrosopumilus sp.]